MKERPELEIFDLRDFCDTIGSVRKQYYTGDPQYKCTEAISAILEALVENSHQLRVLCLFPQPCTFPKITVKTFPLLHTCVLSRAPDSVEESGFYQFLSNLSALRKLGVDPSYFYSSTNEQFFDSLPDSTYVEALSNNRFESTKLSDSHLIESKHRLMTAITSGRVMLLQKSFVHHDTGYPCKDYSAMDGFMGFWFDGYRY
jgi:hypothetical protein